MTPLDLLIYSETIRQALSYHKGTSEEISAAINGVCTHIEKELDTFLTAHEAAVLANDKDETIRLSFTILARLYTINYAVTALAARTVRSLIKPEMLLAALDCLMDNCDHAIQTGAQLELDAAVPPPPTHPAPGKVQ